MISYAQAIQIITGAVSARDPAERQLGDLRAWATATDTVSHLTVPPTDNSAMDGFALRSADTASGVP